MESLVVGRLRKAHGLDGEMFASAETGDPELVFAPGRVFGLAVVKDAIPEPTIRSLTLTAARPHKGGYLLRFAEIANREAAESLRGREITVPADTIRPLEEDEFFLHELVGLEAWRVDAERIGEIVEVYELGGQVLLGIAIDGRERLVPFRRELVAKVDRDAGRVWIDPPLGLLEL